MDLEAELDRLYQGPATEFVAERNKLAQALRKSDSRQDAERVARLQRPSPTAWAVNQLHFEARDVLEALREAGLALREAQESSDIERFAERKRAHQEALAEATDRAVELAESHGVAAAGSKRRIEMTLTVLSTAAEEVSPPPGRMSAELEPLGFDAFTALPQAPPPKAPKRAAPPEDSDRTAKLVALKGALDAADKELRRLERESERSQAALERAERDVEDAEQRAAKARRELEDSTKTAQEARGRVEVARQTVEEARRALEDLEK